MITETNHLITRQIKSDQSKIIINNYQKSLDSPIPIRYNSKQIAVQNIPQEIERKTFVPMIAEDEFIWDSVSMKAALCFAGVLLPPGQTGPRHVARACGVSVQAIHLWRQHPDFSARIDHIIRNSTEAIIESGLALKSARLLEKQKRHRMLTEVIENRQDWAAEHAIDDTVMVPSLLGDGPQSFILPGIGTGALVVKLKSVGSGAFQTVVPEVTFDTALFTELRALETDIARELGQLNPESSVNINLKMYAGIDLTKV